MRKFDPPLIFGEWLKQRRMTLDLTQVELAQRAGCSVFAVRKIETGERRPSKQLAGLLAQALEIPTDIQGIFIRVARGELNLERLPPPDLSSNADQLTRYKAPIHQIPQPGTPLVGRKAELAALDRLFNDPRCRLLTLLGLGGIGKTSLALEFAHLQRDAFSGSICFVSLASLGSPDLIVPAIADVAGLTFSGPTDLKEQLLHFLDSQVAGSILLVLDNLEHLLTAQSGDQPDAASLVSEFLTRLPNLKILATSREPLNLQGEWMYELYGLPVPPLEFTGALEDYAAAALFMVSASRVKPDFVIEEDDQPALIHICRLLDGIPLAIELAAAWVGMLSCMEIAKEIQANLDFLRSSLRDVPERHRSIRATFNHSWKLLSDDECRLLPLLSVFQGGFSRQAAEQIVDASLPLLAALHAKSLVRRPESGRFDLHEVIRQYASELFDVDQQVSRIRDRHCEYYLGLVRDREKTLKSAAQQEAIREFIGEMDNVRAAWVWAIKREKFELIGETLRSFGWLFDIAGWLQEGIEQMEQVVQALRLGVSNEEHKKILGHALAQQGLLYFRKGLFDKAQTAYEESLAILRPTDDADLMTDPLVLYGVLTYIMGDIEGGQELMEEGLACARASGNQWFEAYALYNLGYIDSLTGRYSQGYEQMLAGLDMWRQLGDPSSTALGLNFISPTAIKLGYLAEAQAFLEESLSLCTQTGERWGIGTAYRNMGLVAIANGDIVSAKSLLLKSLEVFDKYIVGWDIARSLTYLGDAAFIEGDMEVARKAFLDGLHIALQAKSPPIALDALLGLAHLHYQAGETGRALELAAFVGQRTEATYETTENAKLLLLEVEEILDEHQIHDIHERVQGLSLDEVAFEYINGL